MTEEMLEKNKLFVWGLNWKLRGKDLVDFFSQWWKVTYATVILDKVTKKSKGFGFVEFETPEDASNAQEKAHDQEFSWRKILVTFARKKEERPEDFENNE